MSQFHLSNHQKEWNHPSGESIQGVRMEWFTLGCPLGTTPTCHYSPEGGPVEKMSPTDPHTPSPFPPQSLIGQLLSTLEIHQKKFKVVNENN